MYRMTIIYGTPDDPAGFRDYYYAQHIPLASKMKGLTGWSLSWIDADDPAHSEFLLIAELYADSKAAMNQILNSPEGLAARDDLANFATGTVTFLAGEEEQVPLS